jgi:hypothetical protein
VSDDGGHGIAIAQVQMPVVGAGECEVGDRHRRDCRWPEAQSRSGVSAIKRVIVDGPRASEQTTNCDKVPLSRLHVQFQALVPLDPGGRLLPKTPRITGDRGIGPIGVRRYSQFIVESDFAVTGSLTLIAETSK